MTTPTTKPNYSEDTMACPWCDHVDEGLQFDIEGERDGSEATITCEECGGTFHVTLSKTCSFDIKGLKPGEDTTQEGEPFTSRTTQELRFT